MKKLNVIDLAAQGKLYVDYVFQVHNNLDRENAYHPRGRRSPAVMHRDPTYSLKVSYKATSTDSLLCGTLFESISKETAELISNTWPVNIEELMTTICLAGDSEAWLRIEDKILDGYNTSSDS
jgi:hypothetical protein